MGTSLKKIFYRQAGPSVPRIFHLPSGELAEPTEVVASSASRAGLSLRGSGSSTLGVWGFSIISWIQDFYLIHWSRLFSAP